MIRRLAGKIIRPIFRSFGYDVARRPPDPLASLVKLEEIDTIVDVGANDGQFGLRMRKGGFNGRIISIEPLSSAFVKLQATASLNGPWEVHNNASGDANLSVEINIAANSESSSILPMCRRHEEAAPEACYVGKEAVRMRTLDSQFQGRIGSMGRTLLKLDVQGFEGQVLSGAESFLEETVGVLLEASIVPLYEGSILLEDALRLMRNKGFLLYHIERVFCDPGTKQILQVDCAFFRGSALPPRLLQ